MVGEFVGRDLKDSGDGTAAKSDFDWLEVLAHLRQDALQVIPLLKQGLLQRTVCRLRMLPSDDRQLLHLP